MLDSVSDPFASPLDELPLTADEHLRLALGSLAQARETLNTYPSPTINLRSVTVISGQIMRIVGCVLPGNGFEQNPVVNPSGTKYDDETVLDIAAPSIEEPGRAQEPIIDHIPEEPGDLTDEATSNFATARDIKRAQRFIRSIRPSSETRTATEIDQTIRSLIGYIRDIESSPDPFDARHGQKLQSLKQECYEAIEWLSHDKLSYLVHYFHQPGGADKQDIEAMVNYAFYRTIERFDNAYDNLFFTFLDRTVRGELKRFFRDTLHHDTKISRRMSELLVGINIVMREHGVDADEATTILGADADEARQAQEIVTQYKTIGSIEVATDSSERTIEIPDFRLEPSQIVGSALLTGELQEALSSLDLNEHELLLLQKRNGICRAKNGIFYADLAHTKISTTEIGKLLGVSQSYCSRMHHRVLQRLRVALDT